MREAHLTLRLRYLLGIAGVLSLKARQCFLLWVSVSSSPLPGDSLWGIHSVLGLSCPLCAVVTSYVLWPCPPILWWYVKYTAARNCYFLYTEFRRWNCCDFLSPTCELPLLCVTEILKGSSWLKQLPALWWWSFDECNGEDRCAWLVKARCLWLSKPKQTCLLFLQQ